MSASAAPRRWRRRTQPTRPPSVRTADSSSAASTASSRSSTHARAASSRSCADIATSSSRRQRARAAASSPAPESTARCGCGTRAPRARSDHRSASEGRRPATRASAGRHAGRRRRWPPAPSTSSTCAPTDSSHACASTKATPRSRASRATAATCSPAARTAGYERSRRATCGRSGPPLPRTTAPSPASTRAPMAAHS